jgi:plastocyanin
MLDMKYSPDFITVVVGQRITWSNDSKVAHTVTSGKYNKAPQGKEFNSFWIMPGKSWSWIPTKPGIYEYFCMPHAIMGMTGTIVVIE